MKARGDDGTHQRSVLFVGSSGGHLEQMVALRPWYEGRPHRWVTFDTGDAISLLQGENVVWAYHPTTRNVKNLVRNTWLAWRVLRDRPSLVVSTGAAVAFPFFVLARLKGVPTIFVEVYDRLDSRTLTGRLCRPFSTEFLVQWPEQRELYPSSIVIGPLL